MRQKKKPWAQISRFFLFGVFLFFCSHLFAYHYQWTPELVEAYKKINRLELEKAQQVLLTQKQRDPENLVIPYLEDYIFFYTYYITEDADGFEALRDEKEKRLSLLELGPEDAPEHYQFQAEVLLHWAMVRAKFDERYTAAREINQAFKMLKENERLFPGHMASMRVLYAMRAGFGSLPKKYKWVIRILSSLEGTIEEGIDGLHRVMDHARSHPEFIYGQETEIITALVFRHFLNEPEKGLELLRDRMGSKQSSPILRFAIANTAQASGANETVIVTLEDYDPGEGELPILHFEYMLGKAKVYRNDPDAAEHLLAYVQFFKGLHFIKEAYQKLAWNALIHHDAAGYGRYMKAIQTSGEALFEGDKQALEEANSGNRPNPELLKARLLFDGGYYPAALEILQELDQESLNFPERLEFNYRSGRIHQALGDISEALGAYQRTLLEGRETHYYFPCNAALQSGLIYEQLGYPDRAREFFELCLSLEPSSYESSLHQKAKLGLNRIKQ